MTRPTHHRSKAAGAPAGRRAQTALARLTIFWENFWPAILPALAAPFLFCLLGLVGLWQVVPALWHWLAIAAAALASLYALRRFAWDLSWPSHSEGLARLEADGETHHAPLRALADTPSDGDAANPLWRAHRRDMEKRARAARLRKPQATIDARDPWCLRFAALGALAIALVAAGDDAAFRLRESIRPQAIGADRLARADLWIEPPDYADIAPLYLARAGEPAAAGLQDQLNVLQGSVVHAQISGAARRARLQFQTTNQTLEADAPARADDPNAPAPTGNDGRLVLRLDESGALRFRLNGRDAVWPIGVFPDQPPRVAFSQPPSVTDDAQVVFAVTWRDDHGVTRARLRLRLDGEQDRPLDHPAISQAALEEERFVELEGLAQAEGERRLFVDLQSDPWAGLGVLASVVVQDGAGATAETEAAPLTLPRRPFFRPLAKSIIEQRTNLAVAADEWPRAGRSLDALTLAPEQFYERSKDYLLVRTAFWRVLRGRGRNIMQTVADFWPLALQLEDEALELARRQLEAAEDALREALERGANDAEVADLVEALRSAMNNYIEALANSGQASGQDQNAQSRPTQQIERQDLDGLLDSIRDLARSGARNAARQTLADLENILNNMRLNQGGGAGGRGGGQTADGQGDPEGDGDGGAASQASDLIGRQRGLANRAFGQAQEQNDAGASGGYGDSAEQDGAGQDGAGQDGNGAGAARDGVGDRLASEQRAIARDLAALQDALAEEARGGGDPDPTGEAAGALNDAARQMHRAENALRSDSFDAAQAAMERAIARLRDGADALADAAGQQQGRQAGQTNGEGGDQGPAVDPLGRTIGEGFGADSVNVPTASDYQRARDVLEELRKRLSDGERTEEEIRYLERLLERF